MGAWGPGLFSDDDALDARDSFMDLLAQLQDVPAATMETLRRAGVTLNEPGDDTAFVLGLAITQLRCGWLQEAVKNAALAIICSGADLARWTRLGGNREERQEVLEHLRSMLLAPARRPRRFPPKPPAPTRQLHDLKPGEIVARRLPSGRLALMRVVEFVHIKQWNVIAPVVRILKWTSPEMPARDQAEQLEDLRLPLRPDGMSTFTKLSLATPDAKFDLIRPGWYFEVGDVPKSGLTTSNCINMICTLDETLEHAISRWWEDPSLPSDAPPPWVARARCATQAIR